MQTDFLNNGLDTLVQRTLERWHIPGLALAVVSGDEVLHLAGYGQRDPAHGLPVTPDTLFPIASMTKSFAVMSLGLLVDEGKLEWDKPVRDYLPGWQMFDPLSTDTLTVRDMLSHRSGLPSHDWIWWGSDYSRRDLLARLRHLEPNVPIRSRFQYNNVLYMLASLIVEEVAGMSWERFVQTRIFDVLGMKRSNFSTQITQQDPDHSRPHVYRDGLLRECTFWEQDENSVTGAAGSINSCASELTTWLTLQMNAGKVGQRQFVKPETLEAMHLPNIFIDDPDARRRYGYEFSSYGMGWFLRSHKGQVLISHGGSINGFWSTQYFMPRQSLGVVALSNCDEGRNAAPVIISLTLFDHLLGLEPTGWDVLMTESYAEAAAAEKKAKEDLLADRVPGAQPAHPLDAYTGEYEHPGYGHLSIRRMGASLQMIMNNKKSFTLTLAHDDTFEAHEPDWDDRLKLTFIAEAQGRICSLSLPLEEAVADIVFIRQAEIDTKLRR